MQKYDVHFCLVSGQAAPNLFPVVDTKFRPNKVVLLVSEDMKQQAKQLEKIFNNLKINTVSYPISQPYEFETCKNEIHSALLDYAGNSDISELDIALNLTGGTKPMSFAAYSVFDAYEKGKSAFYVDTTNHRFAFLTNKENNFDMELDLKVRNYLLAYGYETLTSIRKFNSKLNELFFDFFIKDYHKNKHLISKLNYYADEAEKKKDNCFIFNDEECDTALYNFLYDIEEQTKLISINEKLIDFKENAKLMKGVWLEYFVCQEIKKLTNIDDVEMSLEYANSAFDKKQRNNAEVNLGRNNEFDVAFIANNKLHIIECKTKRMGKDRDEDEKQDIVHKIKSLKNNMGSMAKGCLVVCGKDKVPIAVRNRAKDEGIKIIENAQLQSLGKHLQEWINEES